MIETVLIYLKKDNSYLMLKRDKKKNDLNKDKYIGIGGHIENNETIYDAIKREVKEETNFDLIDQKLNGEIYFFNTNYEEHIYVFTSSNFKGEIKECNEGTLYFIKEEDIFTLNLWEGDKIFLRKLINNDPYFKLKLVYVNNKLKEYKFF